MDKRILACSTMLLWVALTWATSFMPLLVNHPSAEYRGDAQNWQIVQDDDGLIYVANNSGMLVYDGHHWQTYRIPGNLVIRSLMAEKGRVYIGSYEEFGYFERDNLGRYVYTSLSEGLVKGNFRFENEEIWSIKRFEDKILFQSFRGIYSYDGKKVDSYRNADYPPLYIFPEEGRLLVSVINKGLYEKKGRMWRCVASLEKTGSPVVGLLPRDNGCPLLFTESNGVFTLCKDDVLSPFPTEIDPLLRDMVVNRVVAGDNGDIYVGTIQDGIIATDRVGKVLWHYHSDNGLQNNSVLGLLHDRDGNLWAALDDGVSMVHGDSGITACLPDVKSPYLGMVYDICRQGDNLLLATNQGLYTYGLGNGGIKCWPGMNVQNWSVNEIDGEIIVGNNYKTLLIFPDGHHEELPFNSTDIKKGWIHGQEVLVQSGYYNLRIYRRNERGEWRYSHAVEGFGAPVRQLEIGNDGTVWCAHMSRGVIAVTLSPDLRKVAKTRRYDRVTEEAPEVLAYVLRMRGEIVFSTSVGLYKYSASEDGFRPFEAFNRSFPAIGQICSTTPLDDCRFWVATPGSYNLVEYNDSVYRSVATIPMTLFPRRNNGSNNSVYVDKEGVSYFNINNGVGKYVYGGGRHSDRKMPKLRVLTAAMMNVAGEPIPLDVSQEDNVVNGNLHIQFAFPDYNNLPWVYEYVMEGATKIVKTSDRPDVHYDELPYGDYTLHAYVKDPEGEVKGEAVYEFTVPRPFYLRWWAILIYIMMAMGGVMLIAQLNARRVMRIRKREYEAEKAVQTAKLQEQELIIAAQQKSLLEAELSSKGKELASLALNAYSKQQVIDNLKDTLSDRNITAKAGGKTAINLLRQIESAETDNREFWDVFEKNFDLIHEHFFRNLRVRYPKLTANDLKFCALLRMNLATKDIAKFTNLTVRGVETARYRLRKKLQLGEDESLVQFLIDFTPTSPQPR